jgi:hypothetical protein
MSSRASRLRTASSIALYRCAMTMATTSHGNEDRAEVAMRAFAVRGIGEAPGIYVLPITAAEGAFL